MLAFAGKIWGSGYGNVDKVSKPCLHEICTHFGEFNALLLDALPFIQTVLLASFFIDFTSLLVEVTGLHCLNSLTHAACAIIISVQSYSSFMLLS